MESHTVFLVTKEETESVEREGILEFRWRAWDRGGKTVASLSHCYTGNHKCTDIPLHLVLRFF